MKKSQMDSRKATMIAIIAIVCMVLVVLMFEGVHLYRKTIQNEVRLSEVDRELEKELERADEIAALKEEIQSDEFIEKMAKEKLGLIKDNEIIFKEKQ